MFDNSIIKKTGQMWKLNLAFMLTILGAASLFYGINIADAQPDSLAVSLVLCGIIVALASLIFGIVSIRCPNCKTPWLWQGISGKSSNQWLIWLLSRTECPKCKK